jgi:hypothetical protein
VIFLIGQFRKNSLNVNAKKTCLTKQIELDSVLPVGIDIGRSRQDVEEEGKNLQCHPRAKIQKRSPPSVSTNLITADKTKASGDFGPQKYSNLANGMDE